MPDAKSQILEAAKRHFADQGYSGTSLDQVIAASQTSKGTLYHHFGGKEGLYVAVLETALNQLWASILPHASLDGVTRDTFWSTFARVWMLGGLYLLEHPVDLRLWRGFERQWRALSDAGPTRLIREKSLASSAMVARRGQELGCVRSDLRPEECAELMEALDAVADRWFFDEADANGAASAVRRVGPMAVEMMWRAIAPADVLRNEDPAPKPSDFLELDELQRLVNSKEDLT
ncbi:MAG: TetR/AcrR family transcriptional regulator [Myxococcota bacterium]